MGFISWYYSQGLKNFLVIWRNFLEFFWYYFSVPELFLTLFSPWKRDVTRLGLRGFHPVLFFQNAIMNTMTRIVGAIVKFSVILFAIIIEIGVFAIGMILLFVWLLNFLALAIGLAGIYFYVSQWWNPLFFISIFIIIASLLTIAISIRAFKKENPDYYSQDLSQLSSYKWFKRVWNRMGVAPGASDINSLADPKALNTYLSQLDLTPDEFQKILDWEIKERIAMEKEKKFWSRENLLEKMPIGRHWTYAYTINLDRFARDLSEADFSQYRDSHLVGKEKDLEELMLVLVRPSQNNVILVGEPGVGRDTIVHKLARDIRHGKITGELEKKRILEIDLKEVLSNFPTQEEKDMILGKLFTEASYAGNIIIFIKNIHEYMDSESGRDVSPMLSEFLSYPTFQIIGTTTPPEFHSKVETKGNVMKFCDKIIIEEMNPEDSLQVMLYKLRKSESRQVFFTYQGLREVVKLSGRYINDSPYPEKALDLMEEVILFWSHSSQSPFITAQVVDEALSNKIKVPLGDVRQGESEKLLNLENILHQRVIGQNLAISQISETMRRARVGMASENKPLGSFLFLGPTGVGKTESSKALAEAYFGDEDRMIRLDMSEYQNPDSIDRLIGSATQNREGYLVSKVKENPYALLLLDEIEKADPDILNLFLQILDEGSMTNALGKKINFKNLIIIATSNAGADIIKESIEAGLDTKTIQEKVVDHVIKNNIFRPEFLNRFEGVIFFHPLSQDDILKVTELLLNKYSAQLKGQENIEITFGSDVAAKVASLAYDPVFGARAIDRFIQDKIGDTVVKKIIAGEIKKGGTVEFNAEEIK